MESKLNCRAQQKRQHYRKQSTYSSLTKRALVLWWAQWPNHLKSFRCVFQKNRFFRWTQLKNHQSWPEKQTENLQNDELDNKKYLPYMHPNASGIGGWTMQQEHISVKNMRQKRSERPFHVSPSQSATRNCHDRITVQTYLKGKRNDYTLLLYLQPCRNLSNQTLYGSSSHLYLIRIVRGKT